MKTEEEKKYFIINMLELCYNFFKNDSFTENQLKTQIDVLTDGLDKTLNTLNFEEAKKMIIKKLAGGNGEVQFFNPSKIGRWIEEVNNSKKSSRMTYEEYQEELKRLNE